MGARSLVRAETGLRLGSGALERHLLRVEVEAGQVAPRLTEPLLSSRPGQGEALDAAAEHRGDDESV
jgi:hypothetical protein